jgi:cytoskeletal protein RodZ
MSGASNALGERFRAAREARGISLSQVADQIRIRSLYLAAIEEEKWGTIGAPVYVRGFLRTYARFLGLDPEEAVATFNRTLPPPPPTPEASSPLREAPAPPAIGRWAIWVSAVVAMLLIAFVTFNELSLRQGAPPPAATSTPAAIAQATPVTAAGAPAPEATATPAAGVADGTRSLALVLSAASWLRVTVDGNVSMEGTFPAGTSKTFHGKTALVRLGNAGGVEIYVDGKDFGKLGKQGDVVEHAFTL